MTLTGTLGFVPIDEILRLLTRSNQEGAVHVTGDDFRGRVFIGHGGVDLATTSTDELLHRHLVNSGFAEEEMLRRVTSGETTLAALSESNQSVIELLREITVESIFQIADRGGEFEVREGETTRYASPKTFDLEKVLVDSQERKKEWVEVSDAVQDLQGPITLRHDLGERPEISVKNDDWKVLSEVQNGRSVEEIADQLGTTEFWTARVVARLVNNDLVEIGSADPVGASDYGLAEQTYGDSYQETTERPEEARFETPEEVSQESAYDDSSHEEPAYEDPYRGGAGYDAPDSYDEHGGNGDLSGYEQYEESEPVTAEESAPVTADESYDENAWASGDDAQDESWWQEPEDSLDHGVESSEDIDIEDQSEIPPIGQVEDSREIADSGEAEEDTEAFLEKVFSELESDKAEPQEGHGLLRRRRMGSLRDFSSDS